MLTGDTEVVTSWTLGLEGRRPRRPFKLSVLTTAEMMTTDVTLGLALPALIRVCAKLTFLHHADSETLLETAELASIPPSFVDRAVLVCQANILGIFLDCALPNKHKNESKTHLLSSRTKVCTNGSYFITLKNPLQPSQVRTP